MNDCIFCKIIKGEISSTKVYENDKFFAFLDIEPVSEGHLLIIPKEHIVWMQDANDETISGIFILAKKLMKGIMKALNSDYVQVSVAGKDVPHFHVHLIPRKLDDDLVGFKTKKYEDEESKKIVADKIIQAL